MGATLDKPVTEKHTERGGGTLGDGSEYRFGASGMQGWRREMEDRHTCATEIPGLEGHAFFAVYDGHGGDEAADLSEQRLLAAILQQPQAEEYRQGGCTDPKQLGDAMVAGFKQCDAEIRPLLTRSGTTAVCCFVTPNHFVCANAGDSRGVYCKVTAATEAGNDAAQPDSSAEMSVADLKLALKELGVDCSQCVEKSELQTLLQSTRSGSSCDVVALSEDHKPDDPIERARVLKAGGTVAQGAYDWSSLSRSIRWLQDVRLQQLLRRALTSLPCSRPRRCRFLLLLLLSQVGSADRCESMVPWPLRVLLVTSRTRMRTCRPKNRKSPQFQTSAFSPGILLQIS